MLKHMFFVLSIHLLAGSQLVAAEPLLILNIPGSGTDPNAIDYDSLPRLKGDHAVINPVAFSPDYEPGEKLEMTRMRLNLHNYLAYHDGQFWCIWSDGPKVEDWPTQEVKFATSRDGLNWSKAQSVTGTPKAPYAFIARGLWVRDGKLLTLAAHYRDKGAFGANKELELWAYRWNAEAKKWEFLSKVYDNAINNFPPQKLPTGDWILTRRDARFNVTILIGGKDRLDDWREHRVVDLTEVKGFRPDEPIFWLMPDKSLNALFRDNGGSQRLFHSTSRDLGETWTTPKMTNFPNSTSKIFSTLTSRGYRVMVSNSNAKLGRRQLHLSISEDGRNFTRMAMLDVPAPPPPKGFESIWKKFSYGIGSLQYPHVIEHDGYLWIALSRCKLQTEMFRVPLDAVDELLNDVGAAPARPNGKEDKPKADTKQADTKQADTKQADTKQADTKQAGVKDSGARNSGKTKSGKQASIGAAETPRDSSRPAGTRPNVLFLAIDDLNDWIGALGGHPQAKTPNLDRLIAHSVLFSNAHCAAPVCSASRHALMSGLRPSTTGWYSNSSKSRKNYERVLGKTVPMPTHFKRHGYRTLAAGKIFHRGTSDVKDYDYWDEARPKYKWPEELAQRGHGYQGAKGGHFHPFPADGGAIYQKYKQGVDGQSLCWGALEKADMPPEGMPDEQIAAWAVDQLQQKQDKPFFLAVGFVRPHVPYTAPKKFFDLYPPNDIVMPKVPLDEMDDIPLWGKAFAYGTIQGGDHHNVLSVGPNYWREMVRAYLACVSFVDAQAGKVLDALESSPHADNTIVVFWSDHGQHLGEKRHWRKMALWEESTRVPLAVRLPEAARGGAVCAQAVSLLDIYPTLLGLCDLPDVAGLEGVSLLPQLQDPKARRTEPAITTWQYGNHAARSLNFRYIRYRDGSEELYDHRTDSNEHHNLAADPGFANIKEQLAAWLPTTNVMPVSLKNGGLDAYGRKVQRLRDEGVPDWLGQPHLPRP